MLKLLARPDVSTTVSDQCQYGLEVLMPDGSYKISKKPTRWASSSAAMLSRLSKRCAGDHVHQHLEGGLTRQAAYYPRQLVLEILRGIRDTYDMECLAKEEQKESLLNSRDDAKPLVAQSRGVGNAPDNRSWTAECRDRDLVCAAQKAS